MFQRIPCIFVILAIVSLASCKETEEECNIGALGCQCTVGGTCDENMTCNSDNVCVSSVFDPNNSPKFKPTGLPCGGTVDEKTGLHWEHPANEKAMTRTDANDYCTGLGGNWRLPTVEELRTIVSDACEAIATGGPCPIGNQSASTEWNDSCFSQYNGCEEARADNDNCFIIDNLGGKCTSYFWSSSLTADTGSAWVISFDRGSIFNSSQIENARLFNTRCVCSENTDSPFDSDTATDSDTTE